jgi:mono/diheme cytochrome c family protein
MSPRADGGECVFSIHELRDRARRARATAVILAMWALWPLDPRGGPMSVWAEPADNPARSAAELYRSYCQRCHGEDGRGAARRRGRNGPPDLTNRDWHSRRSDARLTVSILDGRGTDMPPFRGRLSDVEAKDLVARVRAFAPPDLANPGGPPPEFEAEYRRLKDEFNELRRQFRELDRVP